MSARDAILIVLEAEGDMLPAAACELVSLALRLKAENSGEVGALLLHEGAPATLEALAARGVDAIFHAAASALGETPPEARLASIQAACAQFNPAIVLLAHDVLGAELGPRLAFRLEAGAVTDCIDVAMTAGLVRCTRPCYGGLAREVIEYAQLPVVATVRSGVCEPAAAAAHAAPRIQALGPIDPAAARVRVVKRERESVEGVRLEDARVIVAGGRGLDGAEGFALLRALAAELGAAVGASRVPCDLGWCPHSWQIGLTGKTVTPELYIAVGISGAGHHMAGCGNAKTIVAINADPDAAIFRDARFGVVGDYRDIVPALTQQVRRLKQDSGAKP
ncbi:MAG: electron transfer flavoprotein subunit alpha/FixB family protein [Burkholderiales bacterium]|nr:electron transfer flavoprotein subunit alpha/FixB family protein [Burkholderiales bacterium]